MFSIDQFIFPTTTTTSSTTTNTMELELELEQLQKPQIDKIGLFMTLAASGLSGLSGALTQKAITSSIESGAPPRNSFVFSMELAVYGMTFLVVKELITLLWMGSGVFNNPGDVTVGWSIHTAIPIMTNVRVTVSV